MFDRDGLQRVASAGLVLLLIAGISTGIWVLTSPDPPVIWEEKAPAQRDARYHAGGEKCRAENIARTPPAVRQARADECAEAAEQDRIQQENLRYQAGAVKAANEALLATYRQAQSAALQSALLIGTLGAAFWTIFDGRRAINRQLRAYLMADLAGIDGVTLGGYLRSRVKVVNVGQTPAYKVSTKVEIYRFTGMAARDVYIPEPSDTVPSDLPIGPGGDKMVKTRLTKNPIDQAFLDAAAKGEAHILVTGCIAYCDVFNRRRYTQFCHIYKSTNWPKWEGSYHTAGNHST